MNPSTSTPNARDGSPLWTERNLSNPHMEADKAQRVRGMFGAIAHAYDLNNRVHSMGMDQRWRAFAVKAASVGEGDVALDVACGTGDLTQALAKTPCARVIGLDFTHQMLTHARDKRARLQEIVRSKVTYLEGDAQQLPFADQSFDVVTIAFGIRNVARTERAIAEFARVLKPGGRLVVLEFDRPSFAPVRWLNGLYAGWIMPRTATLISNDKSGAYKYLPKSVETYISRDSLLKLMRESGFREPTARSLTFGLCACYRAVRE